MGHTEANRETMIQYSIFSERRLYAWQIVQVKDGGKSEIGQ